MKPRLGTVILLVSMVCGTASARTGVIDIADYKGRYDTQDMTPFVYTLLESIPADKPVKLVFPQGTYHFRPEFAAGKYHCITNHDNGYRHFAFPLTGRRNIEIDGGGAARAPRLTGRHRQCAREDRTAGALRQRGGVAVRGVDPAREARHTVDRHAALAAAPFSAAGGGNGIARAPQSGQQSLVRRNRQGARHAVLFNMDA